MLPFDMHKCPFYSLLFVVLFFFSSRRRHTRCLSDLDFRRVLFRSRACAPGSELHGRSLVRPTTPAAIPIASLQGRSSVRQLLVFTRAQLPLRPGEFLHARAELLVRGV